MDPVEKERPKKESISRPKPKKPNNSRESNDQQDPKRREPSEDEAQKYMPKKKNLQIEVIEHPEADDVREASGDASATHSEYEETDPNQYSEQEPNHREGTENEGKYSDSLDGNNPAGQVQSLQSFGNVSKKTESENGEGEEYQVDANPGFKNASNGILQSNLDSFMNKKSDSHKKPTNADNDKMDMRDQQYDAQEYTHEDDRPEEQTLEGEFDQEGEFDDDLVKRQQMEAEELLEETKKTINEDEEDQDVSIEEEEDEVEDIAQMAKENHIDHVDQEEEEEDKDELENPTICNGAKFELNYTVGRIEDGVAILISKDHNLIEIPLWLLPGDIGPGNILKFSVDRNIEAEEARVNKILSIQKQILENPNFFEGSEI